jgi:hypothetical protein
MLFVLTCLLSHGLLVRHSHVVMINPQVPNQFPNLNGHCKHVEYTFADSRKSVVLHVWTLAGDLQLLNVPSWHACDFLKRTLLHVVS